MTFNWQWPGPGRWSPDIFNVAPYLDLLLPSWCCRCQTLNFNFVFRLCPRQAWNKKLNQISWWFFLDKRPVDHETWLLTSRTWLEKCWRNKSKIWEPPRDHVVTWLRDHQPADSVVFNDKSDITSLVECLALTLHPDFSLWTCLCLSVD